MIVVEVTSLSLTAVGLAVLAGLLSFVSPCVLPLLPVYLSFISGVGVEQLGGQRRRLLGASLLFVAGFTVVFMLLGAGAGGAGRLLLRYRQELMIAAGAFIALSGLVVAGVIRLPKPAMRIVPKHAGAGGAFLTGAALAIGWTPCVGYVLGAILTMAASSQSVWTGSLLLLAYSIGLGVPFVLAALAFDWMTDRLSFIKRHYRSIQVGAGLLLFVFGVLLMLGVLERLSRLLPAFSLGGL
ncbi:MAG TPA: cytochrome c biogenesis CcdA family protein [Vicinamibacterales bacterium]|nr:cytochrome c biogenesis CcdA family protein [Vicinamibacterales bacterium]